MMRGLAADGDDRRDLHWDGFIMRLRGRMNQDASTDWKSEARSTQKERYIPMKDRKASKKTFALALLAIGLTTGATLARAQDMPVREKYERPAYSAGHSPEEKARDACVPDAAGFIDSNYDNFANGKNAEVLPEYRAQIANFPHKNEAGRDDWLKVAMLNEYLDNIASGRYKTKQEAVDASFALCTRSAWAQGILVFERAHQR